MHSRRSRTRVLPVNWQTCINDAYTTTTAFCLSWSLLWRMCTWCWRKSNAQEEFGQNVAKGKTERYLYPGTPEWGCITGALTPCPLKGGATGAQVPLRTSITSNFIIYEDRFEAN